MSAARQQQSDVCGRREPMQVKPQRDYRMSNVIAVR